MKFSIIVPVYNIEMYVEKCIDSIIAQKYKNYELIIVNDGSSDGTEFKINKYKKYKNVHIFNKTNGGLSDARNFGIKKAKGEYLMFVDGDDFLYSDNCLVELKKEIIKSKADIIQYKMLYFYNKTKKTVKFDDIDCIWGKTLKIINKLNKNGRVSISACDKIVKKDLVIKNKIYFEKGIISEDIDWSLAIYLKAKTISIINKDIYVYRQQRIGSITSKNDNKRSKDLLYVINKWYNYIYSSTQTKNIYYNYLAYQLLVLKVISKKNFFSKEEFELLKTLENKLLDYDDNYKVKLYIKYSKILGKSGATALMKIYNYLKNWSIIKL